MVYVWLTLFILFLLVCWCVNLIGGPGNWLIALMAALWVWLGPSDFNYHWLIVVALAVLALAGEGLEFGAAVVGTKKFGGSKLGAGLSLVGSIIGGLLGVVLIPIPVIGWIIGPILFACIGALVGALIGEKINGKPMKESMKIGGAAAAGRFFGTLGKLAMGSAMIVVTLIALFTSSI
jgi:uncharacterized protein YqgC (DUF456 family)